MHEEENDGGTPAKPGSAPGPALEPATLRRGAGPEAASSGPAASPAAAASWPGCSPAWSSSPPAEESWRQPPWRPQPLGGQAARAAAAAVPAGSVQDVCPAPARLLEGTPVGTDPQFSPESATARSAVSAAVVSSAGGSPSRQRALRAEGVGAAADRQGARLGDGPRRLLRGARRGGRGGSRGRRQRAVRGRPGQPAAGSGGRHGLHGN